MTGDYLLAWLVYGAAAVLFLAVGWHLSRNWPAWLRGPLRVLVLALVLTPAPAGRGFEDFTAPAALVLVMEALFVPDGAPAEAAARLGVALVVAALVVAGLGVVRRVRGR